MRLLRLVAHSTIVSRSASSQGSDEPWGCRDGHHLTRRRLPYRLWEPSAFIDAGTSSKELPLPTGRGQCFTGTRCQAYLEIHPLRRCSLENGADMHDDVWRWVLDEIRKGLPELIDTHFINVGG
jgi:hypothetical protein